MPFNTFLIIVILMTLSGFVGAAVGRPKGQAASGFLAGFFFGPLGWFLTTFVKDVRKKCPECGGVVVRGARRCQNCGVVLSADSSVKKP